jgi:two-component system, OmpR family, sensor histidine kinase TctE
VGAMNEHMGRIGRLVAQQRAFLDDASHQLRTHLTTLRMQVDYARGTADPVQVQAALEALATELQRASRSTNQLLSLGRSDTTALNPSPFDSTELLQEVAREFLRAARANRVDLGVEGEAHRAHGDRELLREALSNLVANAIAYAPGAAVTLSAAADAMGFSLMVEDNGPGLPAGMAAQLGTRFMRGPGRSGSGLGLAIAQGIAARHGGMLRLEPATPAGGLRATLWWPRAAQAEPS